MSDEWNEMTDRYDDQIKMLEAQMLDNDKKMIVMMLNEVKAIFQLPAGHEREMLVKLEKKLFNDLLFAYNIDKKEMRITNGT
jgi:hypothetical protein